MRFINTIVFCLLSYNLAAFGGGVGNGGDVGQQNILYAYANIEKFIGVCITAAQCNLSDDEKLLAKQIVDTMPAERVNQIEFVHGDENPDFFIIDGRRVNARTGNDVGDTIYIDSDRLDFKNGSSSVPLSIAQAVGLISHELSHHHTRNESMVISFGAKIQVMAAGQTQHVDIDFNFGQSTYLTVINLGMDSTTQVLIGDEQRLIDLSYLFPSHCENLEWPDIPKGSLETKYTWISNPHWIEPDSGHHATLPPTNKLYFSGNLQYQCKFKNGEPGTTVGEFYFKVELSFSKDYDGTLNDYIPDSARLIKDDDSCSSKRLSLSKK
jgi:hypothetical protein